MYEDQTPADSYDLLQSKLPPTAFCLPGDEMVQKNDGNKSKQTGRAWLIQCIPAPQTNLQPSTHGMVNLG